MCALQSLAYAAAICLIGRSVIFWQISPAGAYVSCMINHFDNINLSFINEIFYEGAAYIRL